MHAVSQPAGRAKAARTAGGVVQFLHLDRLNRKNRRNDKLGNPFIGLDYVFRVGQIDKTDPDLSGIIAVDYPHPFDRASPCFITRPLRA